MKDTRFKLAAGVRVLLAVALVVAIVGSALVFTASADTTAKIKGKTSRLEFHSAMRKLWEDHIIWTRLYIVSVAGDLPDQELVAQRLLRNQVDIGNAIKPYYGDEAGEQLTALLNEHILIAAELLATGKAGDTAGFEDARTRWYANADEIAAFLSSASPKYWPLADMQAEMRMHLDLTLQEAVNRLQGNFAADIQDYDAVHDHILGMADVLSSGIMNQFRSRFK